MRRIAPLLIGLLLVTLQISAQDGASGQFCVRAFEDRDVNGQIDAGEPLITRGLGANLLDSTGVIIETALLDNSPTSSQGIICFLNLSIGQYTMEITSADFVPTTADNMTVNITSNPDTQRTLFEYGGQRIENALAAENRITDDTGKLTEAEVERIALSTGGAIIAMIGSALIGLFYYLVLISGRRRRARRGNAYDPRMTTGSMRSVQPSDTGEYPRR